MELLERYARAAQALRPIAGRPQQVGGLQDLVDELYEADRHELVHILRMACRKYRVQDAVFPNVELGFKEPKDVIDRFENVSVALRGQYAEFFFEYLEGVRSVLPYYQTLLDEVRENSDIMLELVLPQARAMRRLYGKAHDEFMAVLLPVLDGPLQYVPIRTEHSMKEAVDWVFQGGEGVFYKDLTDFVYKKPALSAEKGYFIGDILDKQVTLHYDGDVYLSEKPT